MVAFSCNLSKKVSLARFDGAIASNVMRAGAILNALCCSPTKRAGCCHLLAWTQPAFCPYLIPCPCSLLGGGVD